MKKQNTYNLNLSILNYCLKSISIIAFGLILSFPLSLNAQEENQKEVKIHKPVRSTFESVWLIDNQSVVTNSKGTIEMDILHRFGTVDNGYDDLLGMFAPSNIRLGFSYGLTDKLMLGFGITKANFIWDFNLKYAILTQTRDNYLPISVTYFGNAGLDSRDESNFVNTTDRFSYFHQLIIARRFNSAFSIQIAPSISHFNAVVGRLDENNEKEGLMKNDQLAISAGARYVVGSTMAIIAEYSQPITKHLDNNPSPNLSLGIEINTSSHAFQIFLANYYNIVPQRNSMFNQNDYQDGAFLIGFNITRLWNL